MLIIIILASSVYVFVFFLIITLSTRILSRIFGKHHFDSCSYEKIFSRRIQYKRHTNSYESCNAEFLHLTSLITVSSFLSLLCYLQILRYYNLILLNQYRNVPCAERGTTNKMSDCFVKLALAGEMSTMGG